MNSLELVDQAGFGLFANANSPDPYWRIVHIRVINEPLSGRLSRILLRNSATGCRVSMEFKRKSDGKTVK